MALVVGEQTIREKPVEYQNAARVETPQPGLTNKGVRLQDGSGAVEVRAEEKMT